MGVETLSDVINEIRNYPEGYSFIYYNTKSKWVGAFNGARGHTAVQGKDLIEVIERLYQNVQDGGFNGMTMYL